MTGYGLIKAKYITLYMGHMLDRTLKSNSGKKFLTFPSYRLIIISNVLLLTNKKKTKWHLLYDQTIIVQPLSKAFLFRKRTG